MWSPKRTSQTKIYLPEIAWRKKGKRKYENQQLD